MLAVSCRPMLYKQNDLVTAWLVSACFLGHTTLLCVRKKIDHRQYDPIIKIFIHKVTAPGINLN